MSRTPEITDPVIRQDHALVTLVIPCFNEARRLQGRLFGEFAEAHPGWKLLFVDDGSRDGTHAVLAALKDQYPGGLAVLSLPSNVGKAEAVRRGMNAGISSGSTFVGFWDADLATPLSEAPAMLASLLDQPYLDGVIGARVKLLGRNIQRHASRHYMGRLFATCVSLALDLPVYDSQCGAKLFRVTECTKGALEEPFLSRWIFDVELLARFDACADAQGGSIRIVEYPIHAWADVAGSKLTPVDFLRSMVELLAIWLRFRGRERAVRA